MSNAAQPLLLAIALAMLPAPAQADTPDPQDIAISVVRHGKSIDVDVEFVVKATPQEVWDVLTDYDHMSEFVSNVAISRIVGRADDRLEVAQTSRLSYGPFNFRFNNVRELEFEPLREIRAKIVSGDMKTSAFTTRLSAEGDSTRLSNRGRFLQDRWIPPLIGPAVLEAELRKQFSEYRVEILRRKALAAASAR